MHRFQSTQRLVDKVLAVIIRKFLGPDNTMHICLHQFLYFMSANSLSTEHRRKYLNEVNLSKSLVISRLLNV